MIFFDGGMGTMLQRYGLSTGDCQTTTISPTRTLYSASIRNTQTPEVTISRRIPSAPPPSSSQTMILWIR